MRKHATVKTFDLHRGYQGIPWQIPGLMDVESAAIAAAPGYIGYIIHACGAM